MQALRALHLIFSNTVILFLLLATAAHFAITGYYRHQLETTSRFSGLPEVVKRNYSHMAPADVDELLFITNTLGFQYAPWIGMREKSVKSHFVNVDEYGIRSNGKPLVGISQIQNAVWFFGGSTTFGYGVTDAETIPAQLEKQLGRQVINFGVGSFYSAQENLLLVQFLRYGYRPSAVLFLDGVNESCDLVDYQEEMKRLFAKAQEGYRWDPLEIARPAIYALYKLGSKLKNLAGLSAELSAGNPLVCELYGKSQALRTVHARVLAERDSLCRLYEISCKTFVQPFGGVHGRYDDPAFLDKDRKLKRDKFLHLQDGWRKAGAIFVTDALDRHGRHAYLDEEHYSAAACELLARAIAPHLTPGAGDRISAR